MDFTVTQSDSVNSDTTVLTVEPKVTGGDNAACSLLDTETDAIVDQADMHDNESDTSQVVLTLPKHTKPEGWTKTKSYHLVCITTEGEILNSNDFKLVIAPAIVGYVQKNNLIDVYFDSSFFYHTPTDDSQVGNMTVFLASPDWSDYLSVDDYDTDCEESVIYNSQPVSVCHFNLNNNPTLADTAQALLHIGFVGGTTEYETQSADTVSIHGKTQISHSPQVMLLTGGSIHPGETYEESGSFRDEDSAYWYATVDYGDGTGLEPMPLVQTDFFLSHAYASPGAYMVSVIVDDGSGGVGTATTMVTVSEPVPVSIRFTPSVDTFIDRNNMHENHGEEKYLRIQSSGGNRALISFDQSDLYSSLGSQNITSAILRFSISANGNFWGPDGRTIDMHTIKSKWQEVDGLGIDSNLSFDASPSATIIIRNNQTGYVDFDVTKDISNFMQGKKENFGWILKKTDEDAYGQIRFGSMESTSSPELIVTYLR